MKYRECSAKMQEGVTEVFMDAIRAVVMSFYPGNTSPIFTFDPQHACVARVTVLGLYVSLVWHYCTHNAEYRDLVVPRHSHVPPLKRVWSLVYNTRFLGCMDSACLEKEYSNQIPRCNTIMRHEGNLKCYPCYACSSGKNNLSSFTRAHEVC